MVSSVEDYEYVFGENIDDAHPHGDMDRILINGEIMPLRTGASETTGVEKKRILRGEDVCFLREWFRQRIDRIAKYTLGTGYEVSLAHSWQGTGYYSYQLNFSRKITNTQFNRIFDSSYLKYTLFLTESSLQEQVFQRQYVSSSYGYLLTFTEFAEKFAGSAQITDDMIPKVKYGDVLSFEKMSQFFDLCVSFQDYGVGSFLDWSYESNKNDDGTYTTELTENESVSFAMSIRTWKNGVLTSEEDDTTGFEIRDYYTDYGDIYTLIKTLKGKYLMNEGDTLLTVYAPHASKVIAICSFYAWTGGENVGYETNGVKMMIPVQMQEGSGKVFTLMSDEFAGDAGVEKLKAKSGLVTEWQQETSDGTIQRYSFRAIFNSIVPVVFFDDHTKIS